MLIRGAYMTMLQSDVLGIFLLNRCGGGTLFYKNLNGMCIGLLFFFEVVIVVHLLGDFCDSASANQLDLIPLILYPYNR